MSDSAFGFYRPEDSPGLLLWQTTVVWQRLIKKALDPYDIAHAQFVILAILLWFSEKEQETTQTMLIQLSKLDKMTVSKALKKLQAQGYVKRAEHEKDTRAKSVQLTNTGKILATKLVPLVEKVDEEFFAILNKNDQLTLINLLQRVSNV